MPHVHKIKGQSFLAIGGEIVRPLTRFERFKWEWFWVIPND